VFFRSIKPTRLVGVDVKRFTSEVNRELKGVARAAEEEMAKPTRQWGAPPTFRTDIAGGLNKVIMTVHPTGAQAAKYERIDFGTPARVIRPNRKKVLRYLPRYLASTIPNRLWSRLARRSGEFRYARYVHNPGIQARNFSQQVYKKMNPEFRRRMENLIRREVRKGGGPV